MGFTNTGNFFSDCSYLVNSSIVSTFIDMSNKTLINVPTPIDPQDASNKYYTDLVSTKLSGDFLNRQIIFGLNNGTSIGGSEILTFSTNNEFILGSLSTLGSLVINTVNSTPSLGDLIYEQLFYPNNGQVIPAYITGFSFSNSIVRSFNSIISVNITKVSSSLDEMFMFRGILTQSGWKIQLDRQGDNTGFRFGIDSNGNVQYTSTLQSNYTSSVLRFRSTTTSI